MTPRETGYHEVYAAMGITKEARLGKVLPWLRGKLPTASGVRNFLVGDPKRFFTELRRGKALSKGSLVRESFKAPGMVNKALFYGLPAVEGYNIISSPGGQKAERLGELIGDTAMFTATWKPLGYVGSALVGGIGGKIGKGAVQVGKQVLGKGDKVVQHGMPRPLATAPPPRPQALSYPRY